VSLKASVGQLRRLTENAKATSRLRAPMLVEVHGDPEQFLVSPRVARIREQKYFAEDDESTDAFHHRLRKIALRWPGEERPVIAIGPDD
jgi:hypothetical protein